MGALKVRVNLNTCFITTLTINSPVLQPNLPLSNFILKFTTTPEYERKHNALLYWRLR